MGRTSETKIKLPAEGMVLISYTIIYLYFYLWLTIPFVECAGGSQSHMRGSDLHRQPRLRGVSVGNPASPRRMRLRLALGQLRFTFTFVAAAAPPQPLHD